MKSLQLAWRRSVLPAIARSFTVLKAKISKRLYSRPALKRGLLVFVLFALLGAPLQFAFGLTAVSVWAALLAALLLGLGAERASVDWDDTFALPKAKCFLFWHWHSLEFKRYSGSLVALAGGLALALLWEIY